MEYNLLRESAYEANMEIYNQHLTLNTWGNASSFDKERGAFAIKPSGVPYKELSPEKMVVLDINGKIIKKKGIEGGGTDPQVILLPI